MCSSHQHTGSCWGHSAIGQRERPDKEHHCRIGLLLHCKAAISGSSEGALPKRNLQAGLVRSGSGQLTGRNIRGGETQQTQHTALKQPSCPSEPLQTPLPQQLYLEPASLAAVGAGQLEGEKTASPCQPGPFPWTWTSQGQGVSGGPG